MYKNINRPFSEEAWKEPKIIKSYHDVMPDFHWRVQDIVNANIMAGLSIKELAELPAVDASFMSRTGRQPYKDRKHFFFHAF